MIPALITPSDAIFSTCELENGISGQILIKVTAINGLAPTQLNSFGDLIIQSYQVISVGNPVVATLV